MEINLYKNRQKSSRARVLMCIKARCHQLRSMSFSINLSIDRSIVDYAKSF